jgi:type I restriction enzyme S subunit
VKKDWRTVRLGEVLTRRQPDVTVQPNESYQFAGVYSFGRGVFRGAQRNGGAFAYKTLTRLRRDDFVYPKLMAWEGAFGVVPPESEGCYVSPEFPVFEIDAGRLSPAFLANYFRIPSVWESISGRSTGTNVRRRRLSPADLLRREIPLPPLAEQRQMMARVEELAVQIREAGVLGQQATADTETSITSLHTQLAGARTRRLGDILRLDEDAVAVLPTGVYPQAGIRSFGGGLFPKVPVTGAETTYRRFNRLYAGAVVLSQVKGWEGAVAACPEELSGWFVSPEYRTLRCVPGEALPGYMAWLVRTEWFWSKLGDATRGVGARRERTRPEQFLEIELSMPDVTQQERSEPLFAEMHALKRLQVTREAELDALLPAILDRAFNGELSKHGSDVAPLA